MRISDWSSECALPIWRIAGPRFGQERDLELPERQVVALILKLWWQDIVRQARRRGHERAAAMIVRLSDLTIPPFADRSKRRGIDAAAASLDPASAPRPRMGPPLHRKAAGGGKGVARR